MLAFSGLVRPTRVATVAFTLALAMMACIAHSSIAGAASFNCGNQRVEAFSNYYCGPITGIDLVYAQSTDSAGNPTSSSVCSSVFSTGFAQIYPYACNNGGAGLAFTGANNDNGYAAARNSTSGAHYLVSSGNY